MNKQTHVLLTSNGYTAGVSPETGGSLLFWRHDGVDLMRPALPEAVDEKAADKTAMFPLVPAAALSFIGAFAGPFRRTIPSFPILCTAKAGNASGRSKNRRKRR